MSSLSRILDLARNTDGPVVIFDTASDTDFVLTRGKSNEDDWMQEFDAMNLDVPFGVDDDSCTDQNCDCMIDRHATCLQETYEQEDRYLDRWYDFERRALIEDMSGPELLDQINRDIAAWHAKESQARTENKTEQLEQELAGEPTANKFSFDPAWYTPQDVFAERGIGERYLEPAAYDGLRESTAAPLEWEPQFSTSLVTPTTYAPTDTAPHLQSARDVSSMEPLQFEPLPFDAPSLSPLESGPSHEWPRDTDSIEPLQINPVPFDPSMEAAIELAANNEPTEDASTVQVAAESPEPLTDSTMEASATSLQIKPVPFDAPKVQATEAEPLKDTDAPVFYDEPAV